MRQIVKFKDYQYDVILYLKNPMFLMCISILCYHIRYAGQEFCFHSCLFMVNLHYKQSKIEMTSNLTQVMQLAGAVCCGYEYS